MADETKAYDLGRFQRLVGVESKRITGTFKALSAKGDGESWVSPVDVTIWDDGRHSGIILYSGTFSASVRNGVVDLPERMIASNKLADVQDVWDEMVAVIAAVASAAAYDTEPADA